jgi:hypothetical protein
MASWDYMMMILPLLHAWTSWMFHPIDVNFKETYTCSDDESLLAAGRDDESLLAAGRAYESGSLMTMHGPLYMKRVNTWVPESQFMSKVCC